MQSEALSEDRETEFQLSDFSHSIKKFTEFIKLINQIHLGP